MDHLPNLGKLVQCGLRLTGATFFFLSSSLILLDFLYEKTGVTTQAKFVHGADEAEPRIFNEYEFQTTQGKIYRDKLGHSSEYPYPFLINYLPYYPQLHRLNKRSMLESFLLAVLGATGLIFMFPENRRSGK